MGIDFCNDTERQNLKLLFGTERDLDIKPLYTYLCPVIIFICFFSIIFNAILMSISRQSQLVDKSPILLLSLNLAVTDLIASLLNGLSILFNSYLPEVYDIKMGQCTMLMFEVIRCAALVASALHLLALAFVHYRGIVNPLHYRSKILFSQHLSRTINIISIACWIIPLTIMIGWFSSSPCQGFQSPECDYLFLLGFTFRYMVLTLFALPLLLMSAIYLRIFIIISRHQRGRRLNHERTTLTRGVLSAAGPMGTAAAVNLPELIAKTDAARCAACAARILKDDDDPTVSILSGDTTGLGRSMVCRDVNEFDDEPEMTLCDGSPTQSYNLNMSNYQQYSTRGSVSNLSQSSYSRLSPIVLSNGDNNNNNNTKRTSKQTDSFAYKQSDKLDCCASDSEFSLTSKESMQRTFDNQRTDEVAKKGCNNVAAVDSHQIGKQIKTPTSETVVLEVTGQQHVVKATLHNNCDSSKDKFESNQDLEKLETTRNVVMDAKEKSSERATLGRDSIHVIKTNNDSGANNASIQNTQTSNAIKLKDHVSCGNDAERELNVISRANSRLVTGAPASVMKSVSLVDSRDLQDDNDEHENHSSRDQLEARGCKLEPHRATSYKNSSKPRVALRAQISLGANTSGQIVGKEVQLLTLPNCGSGSSHRQQPDCSLHRSGQLSLDPQTSKLQQKQLLSNNLANRNSPTTRDLCTCDNKLRYSNKLSRSNTIGDDTSRSTRSARLEKANTRDTAISASQRSSISSAVALANSLKQQARSTKRSQTTTTSNSIHIVQSGQQGELHSEIGCAQGFTQNSRTNKTSSVVTSLTASNSYEPTRRHLHASAVPQTNTKALVTTLLILGTYFISYVPAIIYQVLTCIDNCPYPLYTVSFSTRVLLGAMTTLLLIAKSIIDPFIYSYRMSEIQIAINRYLTKRSSKTSVAASMHQTSQRQTDSHHRNHNSYANSSFQILNSTNSNNSSIKTALQKSNSLKSAHKHNLKHPDHHEARMNKTVIETTKKPFPIEETNVNSEKLLITTVVSELGDTHNMRSHDYIKW